MKRFFKTGTNMPRSFYDVNLAAYMAGFLESDGSLFFSKGIGEKYNRVNLKFTFCSHDLEFAIFLKETFKMGHVRIPKDVNAVTWEISKAEDVLNFLIFVNGHLRTAKHETLRQAFEIYKTYHDVDVQILPLNTTDILGDAWFAGFSEGDSSFQMELARGRKNPNTVVIRPVYVLEVSEHYEKNTPEYQALRDNRIFMSLLAEVFGVTLYNYFRVPLKEGYNATSSIKFYVKRYDNISQIIKYFTDYPLFSSKYLNYLDWKAAYDLKIKTKNEGSRLVTIYPQIEAIKNGINSKRTTESLSWDHLNNFYSMPTDYPNCDLQLWKRNK